MNNYRSILLYDCVCTHPSRGGGEAQGALNQPPANTSSHGGWAVPSSLPAELAHTLPTHQRISFSLGEGEESQTPHKTSPQLASQPTIFFPCSFFFPCLQHMTDKLNITQVHGQEERSKKETRKELQKVPTSALVDAFQPLQVVAVVFVAAAALSLTHHRILQRGKLARHSRVFLSLSGSTNSLLTSAPGGLLLLLSSTSGEEHLQNKHSFFFYTLGS